MKALAFAAAGLLASGVLVTPASAQPHGKHGWHGKHGPRGHHGWRGGWDRGWRGDDRHWDRGPRGRGNGWGHRARSRLVCRTVRGYYGPQRRCYHVWR